MKTITKPVSIGSDQVKPELREQLGVKPENFDKDHRVAVELGSIDISVPETADDVLALLKAKPEIIVKTLATQLVTNAANDYRKSFTKEGEGAVKTANRERVKRWLFTPAGAGFVPGYLAIPATDTKGINAYFDALFEEHEDELPEA